MVEDCGAVPITERHFLPPDLRNRLNKSKTMDIEQTEACIDRISTEKAEACSMPCPIGCDELSGYEVMLMKEDHKVDKLSDLSVALDIRHRYQEIQHNMFRLIQLNVNQGK